MCEAAGVPSPTLIDADHPGDTAEHGWARFETPWVRGLERIVAAGKPNMCALWAAMRKLVHICYGVYTNQQPYQPQVTPA